jgi:hypothetical protein
MCAYRHTPLIAQGHGPWHCSATPASARLIGAALRPEKKDAAAERRDAQDEFHSPAQARAWTDGDFDAALLSTAGWAARLIRSGRAASEGRGRAPVRQKKRKCAGSARVISGPCSCSNPAAMGRLGPLRSDPSRKAHSHTSTDGKCTGSSQMMLQPS